MNETPAIVPEGWERIQTGKVKKDYKYRYPHWTSDPTNILNYKPFGYSVGVPIHELPESCIIIRPISKK